MNNLELEDTIEALGIETEKKNIDNDIYYGWNDINMKINRAHDLALTGKIPFNFVSYMLKKYPDGFLSEYYNIDEKNAIDDIYQKDISTEEVDKKWQEERKNIDTVYSEAKERLHKRPSKDKYLEGLNIEKVSNAVLFLTELKNYYERIDGKEEIVETDYKAILNKVINNNLARLNVDKFKDYYKKINLNTTKEQVIQNIERNREKLENGYLEFPFLSQELLRPLTGKFDTTINPFLRDDIELEEPADYLEKIDLEANDYNNFNPKYNGKAYTLEISSKDENTRVMSSSIDKALNYKYIFSKHFEEDNSSLFIAHKFVMYPIKDEYGDCGEIINIRYFDSIGNRQLELHYNISGGYIMKNNGDKKDIDADSLSLICNILDKGTSLAKEVTLDNMTRQDNKKMIKKQ